MCEPHLPGQFGQFVSSFCSVIKEAKHVHLSNGQTIVHSMYQRTFCWNYRSAILNSIRHLTQNSAYNIIAIFALAVLFFSSCTTTKDTMNTMDVDTTIRSDSTGYVSIPLTRSHTGHIRIVGELNGLPVRLLVDSGANRTFIDLGRQDNFKMTMNSTYEKASGVGNSGSAVFISEQNTLKLSDIVIRDVELALMDLNNFNISMVNARAEPIDGLLGADILSSYGAIINYQENVLLLQIPSEN